MLDPDNDPVLRHVAEEHEFLHTLLFVWDLWLDANKRRSPDTVTARARDVLPAILAFQAEYVLRAVIENDSQEAARESLAFAFLDAIRKVRVCFTNAKEDK